MKTFVNKITNQIQIIAGKYSKNLDTINEINQKIKAQAKIYYEKYKENKKIFKKERKVLKEKNKQLNLDTNKNIEQNDKLKTQYDELKNELSYFKSQLGIKDESFKKGKLAYNSFKNR